MALTPVEIRHIKPAKAFFGGYRRGSMDDLLGEVALSFEDVWRERADLADKVEQLEADLILEEARGEARSITRRARADHDRLLDDVRRVRSLLRAALATVESDGPARPEAEAA
jgi:cell division septum initiation protein DivIVA